MICRLFQNLGFFVDYVVSLSALRAFEEEPSRWLGSKEHTCLWWSYSSIPAQAFMAWCLINHWV